MDQRQPTGETRRAALTSIQKKLGIKIPELSGVEMPFAFEHLWSFYRDIGMGRSYADGHPLPISCLEIEAWGRMNEIKLTPLEFRIIRHIDLALLEGLREND